MVIQGVKYPSDFEAKKAIIEAGKRLDAKGYAIGGDGSLSVRVGPNALWITVEGADKGALSQDMMVRVDMNGKQMRSMKPCRLPEDLPIHLKVYGENDKVQCVIHGYPPLANAMSFYGNKVESAGFSPAVRAMGSAQIIDASNADAAAQKAALACKTENGILLKEDGCIFWGTSVMEAYHRIEAVEYYAKVISEVKGRMFPNPCNGSGTGIQSKQPDTEEIPVRKPIQEHTLKGVTPIVYPGSSIAAKPIAERQNGEPQITNLTAEGKEQVMQEVVKRVMGYLNR